LSFIEEVRKLFWVRLVPINQVIFSKSVGWLRSDLIEEVIRESLCNLKIKFIAVILISDQLINTLDKFVCKGKGLNSGFLSFFLLNLSFLLFELSLFSLDFLKLIFLAFLLSIPLL